VNEVRDAGIDARACELSAEVEHFISRRSGFDIERVRNFVICIIKFRPLRGSSYIPKHILNEHCTVNVTNNDQKCFLRSVLASLYPATNNVCHIGNYFLYEHTLNIDNLTFPLPVKDIPTGWLIIKYPTRQYAISPQPVV